LAPLPFLYGRKTGVQIGRKQSRANSRMLRVSMTPASCKPFAVPCTVCRIFRAICTTPRFHYSSVSIMSRL
jgi:hypothetical protein